MEIIDIICWTIIGGAAGLVLFFFVWALCVISGKSDDIEEEYWQEYWSKEDKVDGTQTTDDGL